MARINVGKKGKRFERELVGILIEQFGEGFERVPRSGAIFGGINKKRADNQRNDVKEILSGDIIVPTNFNFSIEAKNYKEFPFHQLFEGKCSLLDGWIEQNNQDAELSGKKAIIFFKIDFKGIFVCVEEKIIDGILDTNYFRYKDYVICSLETFLNNKYNIEILKYYWDDKNG